jgi:hypothetical protein
MDSSIAFFNNPFFRFANVAARLLSSKIFVILIFLRPMSAPADPAQGSHRSCFLDAVRSSVKTAPVSFVALDGAIISYCYKMD